MQPTLYLRQSFSAQSVAVLKLRFCKVDLEQPSDTPISLHSLKKPSLSKGCISETKVQKLTADCPPLEDLVFFSLLGDLKFLCQNWSSFVFDLISTFDLFCFIDSLFMHFNSEYNYGFI